MCLLGFNTNANQGVLFLSKESLNIVREKLWTLHTASEAERFGCLTSATQRSSIETRSAQLVNICQKRSECNKLALQAAFLEEIIPRQLHTWKKKLIFSIKTTRKNTNNRENRQNYKRFIVEFFRRQLISLKNVHKRKQSQHRNFWNFHENHKEIKPKINLKTNIDIFE